MKTSAKKISFFLILFLIQLQVSAQAKRVVSLAPSLTKQIYLLEAANKLAGCTSYCTVAKIDQKPIVATAIDVNMEKVIAQRPDLVVTSSLTKPSTIATLEKLGIKVAVYPYPKSFDDLNKQFADLAIKIGKEAKAKEIIEAQKIRLQKALAKIKRSATQQIFMQIGAKPLFCVVPNTFMNDYINMVGCTNVAHDLKMGSITRESVLLRNPDVIFIVTMGVVGDEEKKKWGSFKQLSATQKNQIFIIDANIASTPTPDNFVTTIEEMINLLY